MDASRDSSASPSVAELWRRAEQLWLEAMDVPEEQRHAWLIERCGSDEAAREEVLQLLKAEAEVGDRFEALVGSAWQAVLEEEPDTEVAGRPQDRASSFDEAPSLVGLTLGYVKVHERLGSGGMGYVYRCTDERLGRQVALKVLRPEWVSEPRMVQRLSREAQLLSRLEHPVICQIFDVLQTPEATGLVLELVRGRPLSELILEGVERSQVIDWGIDLAEALAAAHGAGIVHRDLKPSNIMLSDAGALKVLDFGIARSVVGKSGSGAFSELLTSESGVVEATRTGEVVGTLIYMSPEQARGDRPSPATDVFALGMVLFELLEGSPAYSRKELGPHLLKAVREGLVPTLQGAGAELQLLVGRMTATNSGSRPSAGEVAEKLRQIRESPLRRRRQRARGLGVAVLALFGLIMTWQAFRVSEEADRANRALATAREEAERASQEAVTARQVSELLTGVFETADPWALAPSDEPRGRNVAVEEVLRQGWNRLQSTLEHDPATRARLVSEVAAVALALEMLDIAEQATDRSLELRLSLYGEEHPEVADSLIMQADLAFYSGELEAGLAHGRKALAILERDPAGNPDLYLSGLHMVTMLALDAGELEESEATARQCLELSEQRWGDGTLEVLEARDMLAVTLLTRAKHDNDPNKLREAEQIFAATLEPTVEYYGEQHPAYAMTLNSFGSIELERGRPQQAESFFKRGLKIVNEKLGGYSRETLLMQNRVAVALREQGRLEEAETIYSHLFPDLLEFQGHDHLDLMAPLREWARNLLKAGDAALAEEKIRHALSLAQTHLSASHWERRELEIELAKVLTVQGRHLEAEQQLLATLELNDGPDSGYIALTARHALAALYDDWGQPERAAAVRAEAPTLVRKIHQPTTTTPQLPANTASEPLSLLDRVQDYDGVAKASSSLSFQAFTASRDNVS